MATSTKTTIFNVFAMRKGDWIRFQVMVSMLRVMTAKESVAKASHFKIVGSKLEQ